MQGLRATAVHVWRPLWQKSKLSLCKTHPTTKYHVNRQTGCEIMAIFVCPRWPPAAILDIIEPQMVPFDQSTARTLAYKQTWSGSDALFARY